MNGRAKKYNIRQILALAMFAAIAYISLFVMRIGGIGGFLTFDVKDAIIAVAAMIFGPLHGILISFVVSLVEMITISGTGPWGFLMNFVSSAVFSSVASSIYHSAPHLKKTFGGAIAGLCGSVVSVICVMMVLNIFVTPIYYQVPVEAVYKMLLPLLLPFNAIKAVANAAIVFVLYKPLSNALRRIHVAGGEPRTYVHDRKSIIRLIGGIAVVVVCILLMILVLNGHFQLFRKS